MVLKQNLLSASLARKSYGNRPVLGPLDFHLASEEVVCIIGPSGSGKTTLLRLLSGLEKTDSGEVMRAGSVGMVFQQGDLWPHKTVLENVALSLRLVKGLDASTANKTALELLGKLGVKHLSSV